MTIEEAKQMATQGDIRAMCSLGDFYIKQNTGEGIREASKWYELAARKNVIYAIHITNSIIEKNSCVFRFAGGSWI